MFTTKLAIKNSAATKLGEPPMADGDTGPLATTLDDHYDRVRKLTLRKHRWKFAMVRCDLTSSSNDNSGSGFSLVADVPDDLLLLCDVWSSGCILAPKEYSYEGRCIYSDYATLDIKYIADHKDFRTMPDDFVDAFAWLLAAEANPYISGSRRTTSDLMASYAMAILEAKKANMIESPNVDADDPYSDWERARWNGPLY